MVELALATGIPMCHWTDADDATLATALDILKRR